MITEKTGKVIKGLGGLFDVRISSGGPEEVISCRAKGNLKRDEEKVLVGDDVRLTLDSETPDGIVISEILPRKNALIRPPLANLDCIFTVFAAKKPSPVLETVDKLTAIAEHNGIENIIVITKSDLDGSAASELAEIYRKVGFTVFITSSDGGEGIAELHGFVGERIRNGVTAAFAGASGVGKSTLLNALFPNLSLSTAEISRKIERGRHTTRHVEIFDIGNGGNLADTPGFSLIDFSRFDFFGTEDLEAAFPELLPYRGLCRYADCAHVGEGEDECAVMRAVKDGIIPESRMESYRSIYRVLKNKNSYD